MLYGHINIFAYWQWLIKLVWSCHFLLVVPVQKQESKLSFICVSGVSIVCLSMIFLLDFGTVSRVWYISYLSDLNKKDRNKRHSSPFINVVKGAFFVVCVTLVPVSYLSAPSAVHSYRVPGKFIRLVRIKHKFIRIAMYVYCIFITKIWKTYIFISNLLKYCSAVIESAWELTNFSTPKKTKFHTLVQDIHTSCMSLSKRTYLSVK
jgi:hypothetical protein